MNIPQLRFPEFEGKWEKKKLGELFKITAGGDIDSEHVSFKKDEIFKYPIYANTEKNKGLYGFADIYKIDENVITITGRGVNIGIAHARDHKFFPIVRLLVLLPKKSEDIYFFEYQINQLHIYKESTGVPQLTAPQVSGYEVFFPKLQEQQKIASFLTAVDAKLQSLKKKKVLLEQYKKGVMQKIFSQELRFKDESGNVFPDWEEKKLGDIVDIKKGEQLNVSELIDKALYPAINGGINPSGYTDKWNTEANTITISEGGNSCGYINLIKSKFWCGGHCYALLNLSSNIFNGFLFYFLKSSELEIQSLRVGSGLPNIQKKDISSFIVVIPSFKEQILIGNFLSSIDEKISFEQMKIEQAEIWKKGLLQKMFC